MKILAIETSCDETAIAWGETNEVGFKILAEELASQIKLHAPYGGIVPGLAAREHTKNLEIILNKLAKKTSQNKITRLIQETDLIAVTCGPGLMPCLLVGVAFAKALAYKYQKRLIGINHLEGHLFSGLLRDNGQADFRKLDFPALGLIVSGGHTELIIVKNFCDYEILGETLDDAAGEAFDKVARLLGLGYPGGPAIEKAALKGNENAFIFPRPMTEGINNNFSFAGLKTAVLYQVQKEKKNRSHPFSSKKDAKSTKTDLSSIVVCDLAASFQKAVIETLLIKTKKASEFYQPKIILAGGGVFANQALQSSLKALGEDLNKEIFMPEKKFSTDNASTIALAASFQAKKAFRSDRFYQKLVANPNLNLCVKN